MASHECCGPSAGADSHSEFEQAAPPSLANRFKLPKPPENPFYKLGRGFLSDNLWRNGMEKGCRS